MNPVHKSAREILSELNHPSSVVSRYVAPIAIPHDDEEQDHDDDHERIRITSPLTARLAQPLSGHSQTTTNVNNSRSITSPTGSQATRATTHNLSTQGRKAFNSHSSAAASSHATAGASTSSIPVPHPSSGPFHSSLQRELMNLFPSYTASELTMHSKFTPTFYLGPRCRSLEDEQQPNMDPSGGSGGGGALLVRYNKDSNSDANQITTMNPAIAPLFSTAAPLKPDQRQLLQSSFDHVDEVYPQPGSTHKTPQSIRTTIENLNKSPTSNQSPLSDPATAALPPGVKRQLIPRLDSTSPDGHPANGGGVYDVFHMPIGFKVVRDEPADQQLHGGRGHHRISSTASNVSTNTTDSTISADPGVKDRVLTVLTSLQAKYGRKTSDEEKQQPQPSSPSGSTSSRRSTASQHRRGKSNASDAPLVVRTTSIHPSSSSSPSASPRASGGIGHLRHSSITARGAGLTPGPEIESMVPGKNEGSMTLKDTNEIIHIDYEEAAASNKKKQQSSKKKGGVVVGKPMMKFTRIPPSRGTQLLNRFAANVRCCCLVPSTGRIWTAQRDQILVIRDRMTGRVIDQLDTPTLIWCMLVVDNKMWLGTETGVLFVYNVNTHRKLKENISHSGGIHCLALAPGTSASGQDGGVFSGSNDFTIMLWSRDLTPLRAFTGHGGGVRCVLPLSAGRMWSGGDEGAIRIWDSETAETVDAPMVRHTGSVLSLITTGEHVWSASEDGTMCQWTISPQVICLKQIATGTDRINHLMLVGNQVWSCGQDPRIQIWSASTMDWLGALKGHARYLSSFIKIRCMQTRIIWSYGLGEENILVWRSEMLDDFDPTDRYITLVTQLTTQQDELRHLRQRVALAEAAQRALEDARRAERDTFKKQLEDLLLQLAQASAGKDAQLQEILQLRQDLSQLAAQNARLRNELRLHLEKMKVSEEVMKDLIEKVEVKDEHIDALQADTLKQVDQWKDRLVQLEEEAKKLSLEKVTEKELRANLTQQVSMLKSRNNELEGKSHEGSEALAFYTSENQRLHAELAALTNSSSHAERLSAMKLSMADQRQAALEKSVLDLTTSLEIARAETEAVRKEMAQTKVQLEKTTLEKEEAAAESRRADERWTQQQRRAVESENKNRTIIKQQTWQLHHLESEKSQLSNELASLQTTLDHIARELRGVEKNVHGLTKPDHDVYSQPYHIPITFQEGAARRHQYGLEDLPQPTVPFFQELSQVGSKVSSIMARYLSEKQKWHVGYTPATSGVLDQRSTSQRQTSSHGKLSPSSTPSRPSTSPAVPPSSTHKPLASPSPTAATATSVAPSSPFESSSSVSIREIGDDEMSDEDEESADISNHLENDPSQSPVTQVWLHSSNATSTPSDTVASLSSTYNSKPPDSASSTTSAPRRVNFDSSPLSPSITSPKSMTTSSARKKATTASSSLAPSTPTRDTTGAASRSLGSPSLIKNPTYDLQRLDPDAILPPHPTSTTLTALELKHERDEARERRLMALETQMQQRKIALRRNKK